MSKRALRLGGALLAVVAIAAFAGFSSDGSAGPEEKAEAAPRSGKEIISTLCCCLLVQCTVYPMLVFIGTMYSVPINNRVDSKESTQFIFHQHLCLTAL